MDCPTRTTSSDVVVGAGETVRRKLLHECDVHTLLRLPTGIFYAQAVKANVVFFDEFVESYRPGERQKRKPTWSERKPGGRWRAFGYDEIVARDKVSLDLFWLRDESLEDSANGRPGATNNPRLTVSFPS